VLGDRLDSSVSRSAYRAIVYKKGAVVLNTLSRLFEDGAYLEMLGRIVETAAGGVLSTDDFLRLIELFGATELEWFRRQFVDGTGLPNVNYSYSIEALDSGRWAVVGEARQRSPIEPRYAVVEAASGGLDLRTRWVKRIDPAESRLVVGFRIGLADRPGSTEATRRLLTGSGVLSGEVSPFRFVVDEQPAVLWFDPNEEVFGRFLADDHWPKAAAFNSGLALVVAGDIDGGKALMQASLEAEIARIPLGWRDYFPMFDAEREANRANARTHLALASIQLDAGRMGGAERELQDAENLIRGDDRWALARDLLVVESRLRLLSGQTKRAYRQLKKGVLGDRAIRSPATWALLAIAARAEGDTELALRAAERAKELNVDLGPLTVPD
jgi:tetratricopeptide (TPR) repeat protein